MRFIEKARRILQNILKHLKNNNGEIDFEKTKIVLADATEDENETQNVIMTLPDKHIIANCKMANIMTSSKITAYNYMLVSNSHNKKEIEIKCGVQYEGTDSTVLHSQRLCTEYDREVYNAIVSLAAYGVTKMTSKKIYKTMIGKADDNGVSKNDIRCVENSVSKMMHIHIYIDLTNELEWRNIPLDNDSVIKNGVIDTYLLRIKPIKIKYKNDKGVCRTDGYELIEEPILYSYSKLIGQYLTTSSSLLNIADKNGKYVRSTEQRIMIKGYLLHRILVMKGKTPQSKRILLSNLYNMFPKATDRKQHMRIKDYVEIVLDYWKREGLFKGYKLVKKGGAGYAIDITI